MPAIKKTDAPAKEDAPAKYEFVIAEGKSLTSKKGILVAGNEAKKEYFAEGVFEDLKAKKVIVKGK